MHVSRLSSGLVSHNPAFILFHVLTNHMYVPCNVEHLIFQRYKIPADFTHVTCGQTGRHVEATRLCCLHTQTGMLGIVNAIFERRDFICLILS